MKKHILHRNRKVIIENNRVSLEYSAEYICVVRKSVISSEGGGVEACVNQRPEVFIMVFYIQVE